jgi:hypothetical protein
VLTTAACAAAGVKTRLPQDCVSFALKHVSVIGLGGEELQQRLDGLQGAVGCDGSQLLRLAASQPQLLMMHPSAVKVCVVARGVPLVVV